ncbi:phosphoribosylformylglycinamidine cyclo-ligase [Helicobacter saguini]|uniref:Phosphoribosylformylglycinamidine cyclo-ligase n=1 Tax=Helicobacter saguini TaxID=1548018 RepID=A0A347VQ69_9HELI|nr:phosphoribosylformylglycinamidine cyclo-ligase [Helicobacter saguini]MWV61054.1 phosphoribosylformylglycinamidine cyclo-ligase [Helicobacter saguini]MWV68277.1 phosphoribosylformylglycinamidine cyclo-ligase [Helicobacter saguini]MWV70258.1 phosphoribosylformylglycinamidine cyclo-ligase [Helicobacter saguini]MWV72161.1 phosphoribosylformylglycinamidine cyclo-ligase [Helicobacter saguini]TLD95222.1 phosphoribosylformylglycinamidine cyclo-ligase [Helicobacter saguini]
MQNFTYKDFGVDIDSGNAFVERLKPLVASTFSPLVLGGLGGFSGCFELPKGYQNPVLCAATDGVGSKLTLAITHNRLENIGIDLVAMCVNDLICDFATPLVFLDYYAMNALDIEKSLVILQGITQGCKLAGCALIGGESAEMPSVYGKGDFDLAGFSIGVAEKADMLKRESVKDGDIILAFQSSGFHSNGYSLIRGIIESKKLDLSQVFDSKDSKNANMTLLDGLMKPTRIYTNIFAKFKDKFKALAHITGGGLRENLVRVLPQNTQAVIESKAIKVPKIIEFFLPFVDSKEAFRVFNMGVGLCVIVDKSEVDSIVKNSDAYAIGRIESSQTKQVILR